LLISRIANPILRRLTGTPALIVRGRTSARLLTVPMGAPFDFRGRRYLVSGRSETHWVRNLRAAGHGAFRLHGEIFAFRATELAGAEHDRVVEAYRRELGHASIPTSRRSRTPAVMRSSGWIRSAATGSSAPQESSLIPTTTRAFPCPAGPRQALRDQPDCHDHFLKSERRHEEASDSSNMLPSGATM